VKEPWRRWLPLGLGVMGLEPPAFWRLSLVEWRAAVEGQALRFAARPAPLSRDELTQLRGRYPDKDQDS
jgi:uncharacterized phage protein (TIGR02216 family)